jgi:hypothetical protein
MPLNRRNGAGQGYGLCLQTAAHPHDDCGLEGVMRLASLMNSLALHEALAGKVWFLRALWKFRWNLQLNAHFNLPMDSRPPAKAPAKVL